MHGIDEGELEIEPYGHYASSLLYWNKYPFKIICRTCLKEKSSIYLTLSDRHLLYFLVF